MAFLNGKKILTIVKGGSSGGGKTLYQHNIWFSINSVGGSTNYITINFMIINDNPDEMTASEVRNYLIDKGFTGYPHYLMCTGHQVNTARHYNAYSLYVMEANPNTFTINLMREGAYSSNWDTSVTYNFSDFASFTDSVIEL